MNKEAVKETMRLNGEALMDEAHGLLKGEDKCTTNNLAYYCNTFIQAVQKLQEFTSNSH